MSCNACLCIIGNVYKYSGGRCGQCENINETSDLGTYLGKEESLHKFRLHNAYCPNCGRRMYYGYVDCDSDFDGIDVTEEFQELSEPFKWLDAVGRKNRKAG